MLGNETYRSEIEIQDGFLKISIYGAIFDEKDIVGILSAVADYCQDKGFKKLLLADFIEADWTFHSAEKIARCMANVGFKNFKTAIYVYEPKRHYCTYFGETVANNQGVNIKAFVNMNSAIDWIKRD